MTIVVKNSGDYPKKQFDSVAKQAWLEFFKSVKVDFDVVHCLIDSLSGMIRLSARNSKIDETGPRWQASEPVMAQVNGIQKLMQPLIQSENEDELEKLEISFFEWAITGILNGFLSNEVQKKYERWKPKSRSFAIVASPTDEGLLEDDLLFVLWSSDKSLTVKKIRSNQKKAQAEDRKKWPNRKVGLSPNANKP